MFLLNNHVRPKGYNQSVRFYYVIEFRQICGRIRQVSSSAICLLPCLEGFSYFLLFVINLVLTSRVSKISNQNEKNLLTRIHKGQIEVEEIYRIEPLNDNNNAITCKIM